MFTNWFKNEPSKSEFSAFLTIEKEILTSIVTKTNTLVLTDKKQDLTDFFNIIKDLPYSVMIYNQQDLDEQSIDNYSLHHKAISELEDYNQIPEIIVFNKCFDHGNTIPDSYSDILDLKNQYECSTITVTCNIHSIPSVFLKKMNSIIIIGKKRLLLKKMIDLNFIHEQLFKKNFTLSHLKKEITRVTNKNAVIISNKGIQNLIITNTKKNKVPITIPVAVY
jgi:hypothetical protein